MCRPTWVDRAKEGPAAADTSPVEAQVTARPYRIGSSVTSVELLLDARTAAEGAAVLASRQLAAATRLDQPIAIKGAQPGPAEQGERRKFVLEARSGLLGAALVDSSTIMTLADLVMGGRGVAEDRDPSSLELELFTQRLLEPIATIVDAVAPGRPTPVALVERDYPSPARSIVIEVAVPHGDSELTLSIEVLAHHLADDASDVDPARMEAICNTVPLELTFKYTPVHMPAHEVAQLQPGDVICLDHDVADPVVGEVGGRPMVHGRVGVSRRRAAVEVVDLIEGES